MHVIQFECRVFYTVDNFYSILLINRLFQKTTVLFVTYTICIVIIFSISLPAKSEKFFC